MISDLSAEMLLSTGSAAAPVEKAIGTVKEVLCQPQGSSKEVYAVILRPSTNQEISRIIYW